MYLLKRFIELFAPKTYKFWHFWQLYCIHTRGAMIKHSTRPIDKTRSRCMENFQPIENKYTHTYTQHKKPVRESKNHETAVACHTCSIFCDCLLPNISEGVLRWDSPWVCFYFDRPSSCRPPVMFCQLESKKKRNKTSRRTTIEFRYEWLIRALHVGARICSRSASLICQHCR